MTTFQFCVYMATILVSPLIAVQVTEFINRRREARSRRFYIFRTLMTTRATRLALEHVQALNMIDLEFGGRDSSSVAVREAWKAHLDHLNHSGDAPEVWGPRQDDLFFTLLHTMGRALGYRIDMTDLRRLSYFPRGHGEMEAEHAALRKGLVALLDRKTAIPVITYPPPSGPHDDPSSKNA